MAEENKENVPERQSGLTPEELSRMGIDEEGIFNFLHDAIGSDVGTEVLREFSNSDHFAELLDVVTNSLAAEDGRSRRGSTETRERVEEFSSENPTYPTPNSSPNRTETDDVQVADECRKGSSSSGSSVKVCDTDHLIRDHPSEEILVNKESNVESLIDDIVLPQNTETEQSEIRESYTECMSSTKPTSDCEIINESWQLTTNVNDETVEIIDSNDVSEQPEIGSTKEKFIPIFDKEFLKYQSQYNLKHCSTILCNVLGLESDFIGLTCESDADSNKKIVSVPKEKIKEIHRKEKAMRISFSVKLNKSLDTNILERNNRGSETNTNNETRKDKEGKHISDKGHEGKNKSRIEIESGSDNSSSSSDIQYVKRKSDHNSKKRDERNTEQSKGKAEYSAGGTRILPFERKRIPDENRPRKFDKFERMLKEKSKGVKKEKPVAKVEPCVPEKTFASSSFRIPKKKDGERHKPEKKITSLTPLASQDVPSENLKFERYRKTKNNEDRHAKADPYQNKEGTRETYLNETIKIEIELADEPDSFADDDGTASQAAPLSDVIVGHLVLSVATFLRENPQVELPLAEDTATVSELLVVKIAWWFRTEEKDPPSDEILVPELNDAPIPICDDDDNDGSDSFLGHVSNPGEETEECQINEVSSSSYRYEAEDSGKSDEYCGRALLEAKIRTAGENFQNIFDLRNGASYDTKENFQAKCNLCNELIVGKANLSLHVKKEEHWKNLLKTSLKMAKSDEKSEVKLKVTESKTEKSDNKDKDKDSKMKEKEREKDKDKSVKKETDQNGKTDGEKAAAKPRPGKVEMERTKTSTGLPIKVPVMPGANRKRSRSKSKTRSPRRRKSKSPRGKSRSPIQFIVRSPQRHSQIRHSPPRHRHKRRSRSRSPRKRSRSPRHLPNNRRSRTPPNRRRSSSIDRVEEFLARTNRGRRSRSPSNSKRQRRSRSRSPKPFVKPDNKEFHEKLALTVDGKWTADMESRWNLMEAEQNMYLKQFQDRQKQLQDKPEDHPRYAEEWTEFWERRYQEVEKSGKDPDTYDYVVEWKDFWLKRVIFLLQAEGDMKIKEIKQKYGMDYDSLRNLRFTPVAETVKVEVDSFLPAVNRIIVPSNVLNFPPPLSVSDRGSDDQMSRAMSISDDGRSDHKSKEPVTKANPKKANVTVDDIKSTWETLTGQKMGSAKSDAGSSSVASYDFDGFDLVQVLRLMCQIDQTLGIYAQQVQEFFKMAEELEISKRNKSYSLLNKKDFVELLFKCRDKFMNVIRANVVARDVLKSINLTVYALNAILDSPQCQQFKPALDVTLSMELEPQIVSRPVEVAKSVAVASVKEEITVAPSQISPVARRPVPDNDKSSTICDAVAHLSFSQKNEIAELIAKALVIGGRETISDSALRQHLSLVFAPMIANISGTSTVTQESSRNRNHEGVRESSIFHSVGGTRRNEESQPPNVSIPASRSSGSALPPLPTFGTRAATPPPSVPNPLQNTSNPFVSSGSNSRVSSQYHPYGGSRGFGRGRPTSPVSSGRRSPFSRRGYAGNPAPEDKDTDEEDLIYDHERPPSEININLTEAVSKLSNHLLATKTGLYSPPSSLSVSSEELSLDGVPTSVKLPPGILNLIRKERSSEANASSSRYTSTSTKARDFSPQNRERNRGRKHKKERRSRHPNSPSERKENSRDGRRKSRENPRRPWMDENRERKSRRHRRPRRSKSSSPSSIVRLPLQGPSQGVNSSMNQRSPSAIDEQESRERQLPVTPFNYGSERYEVDANVQNAERKPQRKKLRKPSRGVSAIFWETSSISGGEGKFNEEGVEDAFTEEKIKARHYRTQKADLEPGEIISSTDFSEAESIINSCDPRIKKCKRVKPKTRSSAKKKGKKVIVSAQAESQDSFNDFDECMTKENIIPVVDLDTSFEEGDKKPRKIQLDLPIALALENISELSQDKISDGSLTDYESPHSPAKFQKISLTEPVTPDAVQAISCKTNSVVESPHKKRTGEQSSDVFPLGSEILSEGELSDVTVEQCLEKDNSSISTSNFSSKSSKLERIDSTEEDVLSKVSTISSSGNILELKNGPSENLNPTDISTEDSANESVVIDLVQLDNKDKEKSDEDKDKEFIIPVICDEQQSLPVPEKSPRCSKADEADAAADVLSSTNVDSMEESEFGNESYGFNISISKNIFEPVDASCSDDEIEEESNEISRKTLDAASCSNEEVELEDDNKFSKPLNDVPLLVKKVKLSTPQPVTPSDIDSIESSPEEILMEDLNFAQVVDVEFSGVPNADCQQNNYSNTDDIDGQEDSHVETKALIEREVSELIIVELDDLDVTDTIEVTEEFLQ